MSAEEARGFPRALTRTGVTMLLLAAATSDPQAAEATFAYTTSMEETYNGDVFRFGAAGNAQSDYITTFGVQGSLSSRTPRSQTQFSYTPEYLKYYRFDELDRLNHRLTGSWNMTPGPKSTIGIRTGYSQTNQQSGFQSSAGVGGNPNEPILQLTRRVSWDVEPYYRIAPGRDWTMETRLIYRSQSFDDPTLIDGSTAALTYSANRRVGRLRTVGGVLRYGRNFYDRNTLTTTARQGRDQVLNLEASWAQQEGAVFRWRTGLGFFRVLDDTSQSSGAPTLRAAANWNLDRSSIQAGYDLGFSTVTGAVGTARNENTNVAFTRRWGHAFTGAAAVNYIRFRNLATSPVERYLDGYSFDLRAAYRWPAHWALSFQMRHLIQEQSNGRSLDYFQASLGLTFAPDGPGSRRRGP
jgi:hypothetical protein